MTFTSAVDGASVPAPKLGREAGTEYDYFTGGDLLFDAVPGTDKHTGLVYDYETPTVSQIAEMLRRDGKARSLEQALVMPIIGATWRLETIGDINAAEGIASWIDDVLRRATIDGGMQTPISDVIAQKAEALIMRRSYHEKVWKRTDDNKIVYDKVAYRPPSSCELLRDRDTGELRGFTQWKWNKIDRVPIKLPYADVFVHGARRNPILGMTELEVTYHNYRIKEKLKFLWYTYCEVLSLPRQIVLANNETAARKAVQAIAALRNAGVAGFPADWVKDIKEVNVGGASGASEFQTAIGYLDSDSALSLLAGFTELPSRAVGAGVTSGPVGSYALAQSSQNFYMDAIQAYAGELNANITNNLIADLVRYNFGVKAPVPRFIIDLEQEKIAQSFGLLQTIITAPQVNVPIEFVQELILAVSKELGMNTNVISRALRDATAQAQQQATSAQQQAMAPLAGAANVGAAVAAQANTGGGPSVPPGPAAPVAPPQYGQQSVAGSSTQGGA